MTTEREMLEYAAKACGLEITFGMHERGYEPCWHGAYEWNPLTDDGDALRLAVKLRMVVEIDVHNTTVAQTGLAVEMVPFADGDPYAATRRAIVQAAAEIGKAMK